LSSRKIKNKFYYHKKTGNSKYESFSMIDKNHSFPELKSATLTTKLNELFNKNKALEIP